MVYSYGRATPAAGRRRTASGGEMDADGLERPSGVGVVFLDRDRETGDRILEEVEKRSARYLR